MRNAKEKVEEILDSDGALATSSNAIEGEGTLSPQAKSTQSKSAEETGSRAKVCEVKRRGILTSLTRVRDAHATSPWKRRGVGEGRSRARDARGGDNPVVSLSSPKTRVKLLGCPQRLVPDPGFFASSE